MGAAITITNSSSALESLGYTYDETGSRTSMTREGVAVKLPPAVTGAQYDSANRLTSFNGQTLLHDENGNITSWGNKSFIWDSRDRLVEVKEGGNTIATFAYDALGRRVEKTINGVTTKYLYDGLDIVMETDASGTPTVFYIRTLNIDEPLARIELDTGKIRYYHADALGSIIALTDETGTVRTRYNYSSFGDTETIGEESGNPFMFTGREWDDGTGLYYYRARYYSPELGRFISEDPIGLAGGDVNYFAYVRNNPCNAVDPLGLFNWKTYALGHLLSIVPGPVGFFGYHLGLQGAALDLTPEDAVCGAVEGVKHGLESGYYGCMTKCLAKAVGIEGLFAAGKVELMRLGYKVASKTAGIGGLLLFNTEIGLCTWECSSKL